MTSVNRVRLGNRGSPSASGHPGAAGMGSFSQFWRIALGRVCKVCLGEIAWLMGMFRVSVFGGRGGMVSGWGVGVLVRGRREDSCFESYSLRAYLYSLGF